MHTIWTEWKETAKNKYHEPTQREQYGMVESKRQNSPNLTCASQLGRTGVSKCGKGVECSTCSLIPLLLINTLCTRSEGPLIFPVCTAAELTPNWF